MHYVHSHTAIIRYGQYNMANSDIESDSHGMCLCS